MVDLLDAETVVSKADQKDSVTVVPMAGKKAAQLVAWKVAKMDP
jgi:hypothetical protein